jgi:hypothetical protein
MAQTSSTALSPTRLSGPARSGTFSLYDESEIVTDWLKVLLWCLAPIALLTVPHVIEKFILESGRPLIPNPAEFPCRVFGLAHYVTGFLFLVTSVRMRRMRSWAWLFALLATSLVICSVFYHFGGEKNPAMKTFYFLFFLVHGFRDMVFFYRPPQAGQTPFAQTRTNFLRYLQASLILLLMYVLVPAYLIYLASKPRFYSSDLQARIDALMPYLKAVLFWGWPLLVFCVWRAWRLGRQYPGGLAGIWRLDRAVLLILLYTSLIILASPVVGPWTYNLVIMTHFVGWYFYASRRLEQMPRQSSWGSGIWRWMRGSVRGFRALHITVAALFLLAILIAHFLPAQTGALGLIVSSRGFYYWTVIHVTISFAPR